MFYDLNLAVDGVLDQTRREMVAMALQLGYGGVAANHTFTGVMADSDRCKLRPLELRTLLAAAPAVAESSRFHRELLGVPRGLPFRQFTRITVVVENPAQANALNSGNPVLKTYDVVAVRPSNQKAFNQACSHSEVDMISLDLTQKLPFRLKMPVVKAAIERGIYFEISYGRTVFDPKARRELFANAQMLLAAARGRNIIVSSGARKALELRGPNDAANMSTLFGLNLESAKAAVSRNCKAVLMHGVMRKATHRGAIHISRPLESENAVGSEGLFNVPMDWDPLSLGGASADFLPLPDASDAIMKITPARSIVGMTEERTAFAAGAGDSSLLVAAPKDAGKSVVVREQPDRRQEDQAVQEEQEEDTKVTASKEHDLVRSSPAEMKIDSIVRDPLGASASVRKPNVQNSSVLGFGKQAIKDNNRKVEPNVEKLGPKKGKKRKRKK